MYNTSLRIVKNAEEAEDIMQEAFLSAFDKIDTYNEQVSFGAWLKRIVINKSIDAIKRKNIDTTDLDEDIKIVSDTTFFDQNTQNEEEKKIKQIKNAIPLLPNGYRIILSLYLFEGYDHDEIGSILNISSSSSRSQYSRAKQKLREIIEKNKI